MEEIGIDMSVHTPHTMDELVANHFDLVVTLSADAQAAVARRGLERAPSNTGRWPTPTETEGNREAVLSAYTAGGCARQPAAARARASGAARGRGWFTNRLTSSNRLYARIQALQEAAVASGETMAKEEVLEFPAW